MRLSFPRRLLAPAGAVLLVFTGCSAPLPSSPASAPAPTATGAPAAAAALDPSLPGASGTGKVQPARNVTHEASAKKLLEKVLEATGGAEVVDGLKSLVLTGRLQQTSPVGAFEATVTTTFQYPDRMRRELLLPTGGIIATTVTPEGAWMTGAPGRIELPEEEKQQLAASAIRNPVSLLRSRNDRLFRVSLGDSREADGGRRDVLVIWVAGQTMEAVLDGEHRIAELSWDAPAAASAKKNPRVRVRYSDFRTVEGLVYPYASEDFSGEEKVTTFRLESLRVNQPLPAGLFERPASGPIPTPGPSPIVAPVPK